MADRFERLLSSLRRLSPEERERLRQELDRIEGEDKPKRQKDGVYRRKDSKFWWICYTTPDGQVIRESTKSTDKSYALQLLAVRKRDALNEALGIKRKSMMTFGELIGLWLQSPKAMAKRSRERDMWCSHQLKERLGDVRLGDLKRLHFEEYVKELLAAGKAPSTCNRAIALARVILNHGVAIGELQENPLKGFKMLKEPPPRRPHLEPEDEARILAMAEPPWVRFLIRLLLATGCRLSEVLSARIADVDFTRGMLIIRQSKGNVSREVPLPDYILDEIKQRRALPGAPLVDRGDGKAPTRYGALGAWKRCIERVLRLYPESKVKGLRLHDLRHIFTLRAIAAGLTAFEVARLLGHRDTTMVSRVYGDVDTARVAAIVRSLPRAEPAEMPPLEAPKTLAFKAKGGGDG